MDGRDPLIPGKIEEMLREVPPRVDYPSLEEMAIVQRDEVPMERLRRVAASAAIGFPARGRPVLRIGHPPALLEGFHNLLLLEREAADRCTREAFVRAALEDTIHACRLAGERAPEALAAEIAIRTGLCNKEDKSTAPARCWEAMWSAECVGDDVGTRLSTLDLLRSHDDRDEDGAPDRIDAEGDEAAIRFMLGEGADRYLHPVVRVAVMLAWLFSESGPVARDAYRALALARNAFARGSLDGIRCVGLSQSLCRDSARWDRALRCARQERDATPMALHMIESCSLAMQRWIQQSAGQAERHERYREQNPGMGALNCRQVSVLQHSLSHPGMVYSMAFHRVEFGVVYETARTDLGGLVDAGLLHMYKVGRAQHYTVPEDRSPRVRPRTRILSPPREENRQDTLPVFF